MLLRLTIGWGLYEAGSGKFDKMAGVCATDPLPDCAGEDCAAQRDQACREQGQAAIAWFSSLTLFGVEDLHLPGGGALNFQAAAFSETVFGAAVMLGLGTQLVALPLIATMSVAMVTAHWDSIGWDLGFTSELAFLYLMGLLVSLALGAGPLSADAVLLRAWRVRRGEAGAGCHRESSAVGSADGRPGADIADPRQAQRG